MPRLETLLTAFTFATWGRTLLALAALALAGGWILIPFRDPGRRYLWLASPLAGLASTAGTLSLFYYGFGLSFGSSLVIGWVVAAGFTLALLWRFREASPSPGHLAIALAALLVGSGWATLVCNRWSIAAGESVISIADGSDMFGYALVGDWLCTHPANEPPRGDQPFEVLQYVNLDRDLNRSNTFLLGGVGGWVRGTSNIFAYDWACGVALSAAVLGLAGLFARRPLSLALLLAAGTCSAWFATSRCGYFAKLLAYPGCLLLGALFVATWQVPTRLRVVVVCLVGFVVGTYIHPVLPVLVLGLVLAGLCAALVMGRSISVPLEEGQEGTVPLWRLIGRALLLYGAAVGVQFIRHWLRSKGGYPPYALDWNFIVPVSLDLENANLPLVGPILSWKLVWVYLAVNLLLLGIAWKRRLVVAQAFLLCTALVPIGCLLRNTGLYGFHGLLFPLTMIGAAVLFDRMRSADLPLWRCAVVAVLGFVLVGLHLPQVYFSGKRYLKREHANYPIVLAQGETLAMRDLIGDDTVDIAIGDISDVHLLVTDLACQGTNVLLRPLAWDRTIGGWGRVVGCPAPSNLPPKGRYSIIESNAYAPPHTVRFRGSRFTLIEDDKAVSYRTLCHPEVICWDEHRRPGFWLGKEPAFIEIYNGTGRPATVRFQSEGRHEPYVNELTVEYLLGAQMNRFILGPNWNLSIPLVVPPGVHQLRLRVVDSGGQAKPAEEARHLVLLTNLRLDQ